MKFLIYECVGTTMAEFLIAENHTVFSVFDQWRGASDEQILEKCFQEQYILITADKDFGEMVFRNQKVHSGVILIRCEPNNFITRIEVLSKLLKNHADKLENNFVVVTNNNVRIIEFGAK